MNKSNNVNISNGGSENTFNIHQNYHHNKSEINNKYIKFEKEHDFEISYVNSKIEKEALPPLLLFFSSFILLVLGLSSDLIGVLSFFGFAQHWIVGLLLIVALLLLIFKMKNVILYLQPKNTKGKYIGNGELLDKDSYGNCIIYRRSAECIYPECKNGRVYLVDAPEREKDNHRKFVGECDNGGKEHTYRVSKNWIGYPYLFDWRKLEKTKKK